MEAASISSGRVFRRVNKSGYVWGTGVTEKVAWSVVRECAAKAGIVKLAYRAIYNVTLGGVIAPF
jgi:hypothetical protein